MPSAHTWRFAPQGLLKRRRRGADTDGSRARQNPPRPAGGAVRLPETPLPAGLPPLPAGFEPAAMTGQPQHLPDVAASRH
ncbi:hypothetical protein [Streptomyces sp. NBC_00986]|uniref:hypothetical protein n=1 Tax=Streptomyces sp. NBC_00986 TaxID=2903702 RepID=UPI003870580A|nr:hypothetical protein OG504_19820 [Streptomyces sp. NBC_00986]